jgi:hypothetical protein
MLGSDGSVSYQIFNDYNWQAGPFIAFALSLRYMCAIQALNLRIVCFTSPHFNYISPPIGQFIHITSNLGVEDGFIGITIDGDVRCWPQEQIQSPISFLSIALRWAGGIGLSQMTTSNATNNAVEPFAWTFDPSANVPRFPSSSYFQPSTLVSMINGDKCVRTNDDTIYCSKWSERSRWEIEVVCHQCVDYLTRGSSYWGILYRNTTIQCSTALAPTSSGWAQIVFHRTYGIARALNGSVVMWPFEPKYEADVPQYILDTDGGLLREVAVGLAFHSEINCVIYMITNRTRCWGIEDPPERIQYQMVKLCQGANLACGLTFNGVSGLPLQFFISREYFIDEYSH